MGELKGEKLDYPLDLTIWGLTFKQGKAKDEKELIEIISGQLADPSNSKKTLSQIFFELGIDTMQIVDERTMRIIQDYLYYSNPCTPQAPYDSQLWFDSVVSLGQIFQRKF